MKAIIKGLLMAVLLAFVWMNGELLWSSRLYLNEPRIHVIQKGEYLSKIARQYYGKANYWRALALVNRAPNPDKVYPGEQIMLPDAGSVSQIARAKRLSQVNEIVMIQEQQAKIEDANEMTAWQNQPTRSSTSAANESLVQESQDEQLSGLPAASEATAEALPAVPETPAISGDLAGPMQTGASPSGTTGTGRSWFWPVLLLSVLMIGGGYAFYKRRQTNGEEIENEDPEGKALWAEMEENKRPAEISVNLNNAKKRQKNTAKEVELTQ